MCNWDCRKPDSYNVCCLCTVKDCNDRKCKHKGDKVSCQEEISYEQVMDRIYGADEEE